MRVKPALAQEWSATSQAAAEVAERVRHRQQHVIEETLRLRPDGLTTEEICRLTNIVGDSVRPRLVELDEQGRAARVTLDGRPFHKVINPAVVTRANTKGNQMCVWRLVQ